MSTFSLPNALAERAGAGTLAHAYILTAEDPDALQAAATAVSAAMVCAGEGPLSDEEQPFLGEKRLFSGENRVPCGGCKHCRKVVKGVHPDVIRVAPEPGKDLTVEQIRTLRQDAYIRPNEAKRKVYVLENAHKMNPSAQNAFLKVLEDGPLYAAFLLLTPTPNALLPTIRSRCETVLVDTQSGTVGEELGRRAGELAGLLLGEDGWRLVSWCVEREKDKREDVIALFEETRRALLRYRSGKTTAKAVRMATVLQDLAVRLERNGNVGCVWGELWAEAGAT